MKDFGAFIAQGGEGRLNVLLRSGERLLSWGLWNGVLLGWGVGVQSLAIWSLKVATTTHQQTEMQWELQGSPSADLERWVP